MLWSPWAMLRHLNKKSFCIRISGSQHVKQHPRKRQRKKSLHSLQRCIWEGYRALTCVKTEPGKLNARLPTWGQILPQPNLTDCRGDLPSLYCSFQDSHKHTEGSAWKKTAATHPSRNLRMQVWEEIQEPKLAMPHSRYHLSTQDCFHSTSTAATRPPPGSLKAVNNQ